MTFEIDNSSLATPHTLFAPPPTKDLIPDHCFSLVVLALVYLRDLCRTTFSDLRRHFLRSTEQGFLIVPFARTTTKQNRAFSLVGPLSRLGHLLVLCIEIYIALLT